MFRVYDLYAHATRVDLKIMFIDLFSIKTLRNDLADDVIMPTTTDEKQNMETRVF